MPLKCHLQVSLEELEAATASQPLVVLNLEKMLDTRPTCANKSRRRVAQLWSRLSFSSSTKCIKLGQFDPASLCRIILDMQASRGAEAPAVQL